VNEWTSTNANTLFRSRPWLAAGHLTWREVIRFFRQRNRVVGAVGQPIVFWLLFGAGLQGTFRLSSSAKDGQSFLQYYFPGTLILVLLFTAIFSTISIIEDRREGFLQAVLVAPIPRWSMVLGKIAGGALIALVQGLIFLLLALCIRVELGLVELVQLVALMSLASLALTSLGFIIAWRMESTQGFHAIMNLLLMPMWLLSGAFFPPPQLTAGIGWSQFLLHWTMRLNPLSYTVAGVRQLMFRPGSLEGFWSPSPITCWMVTLVFTVAMLAGAWWIAGKRTTGDWQ
jgi:ABC-2 type transport system permease protein